jgi:hypothetical protein
MKPTTLKRRTALMLCLAVLPLVFAPLACRRSRNVKVQATEEEAPRLASIIHMSDPKIASQLVSGFYDVEQNAWRWAQKRFSVVLRPPLGSAQRGAALNLKFTVPDVTINRLQNLTLSAAVNGSPLAPETYGKPGEYRYSRDLPPNLLTGEAVRVDFTLDKAMAPSAADQRELGVVVLSVGLELK